MWCINTPSHHLLRFGEDRFKHDLAFGRLSFCKIVGDVVFSLRPQDFKNSLAHAIADPVIAHVDGFGSAKFYCVVCDSDSSHIIRVESCCWLSVTEGFEDGAFEVSMLRVDIERSILSFGRSATDCWNGAADYENRGIDVVVGVALVAEVVLAAGDGTCFFL